MSRIYQYRNGGDGSDGTCDCIGYIIGAVKLAGETWNGNHGTNYTVRNKMKTFETLRSPSDLKEGELVFKAREPGESGYALPDTYKNSPDQRDYYHVGVVRCVKPLVIEHCTTVEGGIKLDNELGKWKYHGELDIVDYTINNEGVSDMAEYNAIVYAKSGSTVNMRKDPSKQGAIVMQVPIGSEVKVIEELNNGWAVIEFNDKTGYMMKDFIIGFGVVDDTEMPPNNDVVQKPAENVGNKITISLDRELAIDLIAALDAALQ